MKKIITKDQEINLELKCIINPADLPNNAQDIKLVGDDYIDLDSLNLNIVKYNLNYGKPIHIGNCNINKLVLNTFRDIRIFDSNINDIYIQSEIEGLMLRNANIFPNFHGKIHLINRIEINQ